jgi:signal transduction histidine kinase
VDIQISQGVHGIVLLDRDGALWNFNPQIGILRAHSILQGRADPNQLDSYGLVDGLSAQAVISSFEDREGNIWVGTNEGLDRFRPANAVLERQIPLPTSIYGYNAASTADAIYVFSGAYAAGATPATDHLGVIDRVAADGSVRLVASGVSQPDSMAAAVDGGLWIGNDRGLFELKNKTLTAAPLPDAVRGVHDLVVEGVAESPTGGLWVALRYNGLWRRMNGAWSQIIAGRPDQASYWGPLTFGARGVLWMTDHDSVVRYDGGRVIETPATAGPKVGPIATLHADAQGVWFGGKFGLARFDGHGFQTLRAERYPALAYVSGVSESAGYTWIVSHAGILRFDTGALLRALARPDAPLPSFDTFDRRDGVSGTTEQGPFSTSDSSVYKGPDGRLWFLTDHGVDWIDPRDISRNALPPPVAIRSLTVDGRNYPSPLDLRLPAGASNLEIDYAALSFVEPSRVRFRYKLDGVDKDWIDPGERREVFYTRLGPGTYHFHVIAANDAGVWNRTGAVFAFTIAPTFLQSIWFKILVALALAALAWLAFTMRLRQETARLQASFDVRVAERVRISQELHDTLLQGFQGLMLRLQSIANRVPAEDALRASLEDALDRAEAVLAEGRGRVHELRTSTPGDDLAQTLAEAASHIIIGEAPSFHLTVEGAQRPLNALVAEEVLRIFEEAIRNVVAHANARKIEVLLSYARLGLRLAVIDDGVGMARSILTAGQRAGHYGLVGMRERAERAGGRLDVSSREGGGTEVVFSAPARVAYKERAWPDTLRSLVQARGMT